ncbi:MAG: DUF4276 family protein [Planctomycetes bacterium]|nr:DUF4276 family protein [Planctomycetota bacterium]
MPEPGELLTAEMLGPAHLLVARVVARDRNLPEAAVQFLSPLRLGPRPHRGSDLLVRKNLRRLLTIADPTRRPDVAIVLVDEDGHGDRRRRLLQDLADLELPHVIAVPVREFEAWLIADHAAVVAVLGNRDRPQDPESMQPREAKDQLRSWIDDRVPEGLDRPRRTEQTGQLRADLARRVDLGILAALRAFAQFCEDLRAALAD